MLSVHSNRRSLNKEWFDFRLAARNQTKLWVQYFFRANANVRVYRARYTFQEMFAFHLVFEKLHCESNEYSL